MKAEEITEESKPIQVSINALKGGLTASTMKLKGTLNEKSVMILIDSGSTHSFLDAKLANLFNLPLTPIVHVPVTIPDGRQLFVSFKCSNYNWNMQNSQFTFTLRILELGGYDMILGVDWI